MPKASYYMDKQFEAAAKFTHMMRHRSFLSSFGSSGA